jgi:hypothetical protein
VPAAAVIPAPIAYIKVAAVKKLVVGSGSSMSGALYGVYCLFGTTSRPCLACSSLSVLGDRNVYFEKIRVLNAGVRPCIMVHGIMEQDLWYCFVGFRNSR